MRTFTARDAGLLSFPHSMKRVGGVTANFGVPTTALAETVAVAEPALTVAVDDRGADVGMNVKTTVQVFSLASDAPQVPDLLHGDGADARIETEAFVRLATVKVTDLLVPTETSPRLVEPDGVMVTVPPRELLAVCACAHAPLAIPSPSTASRPTIPNLALFENPFMFRSSLVVVSIVSFPMIVADRISIPA